MEKKSSTKGFWEQKLVKKSSQQRLSSSSVVLVECFWTGVCSLLESCFWRKRLKIRGTIFSFLYNRFSLSDLTEAMTVIRIICCVECLAESLICVSESLNKLYFVVHVYICIMGKRDMNFKTSDSTECGRAAEITIKLLVAIYKYIN